MQQAVIDSTAEARALLSKDARRGQWLGWSITAISILGSGICAYYKHDGVAAALVAVPIMSVAKALIDSSKAKPLVLAAPPQPNATTDAPANSAPTQQAGDAARP